MNIRKYQIADCAIISDLFFQTIHSVNAADYTQEQLFAWAGGADALKPRCSDLAKQYTLVAEINGKIVGFGSIVQNGHLDLLFVHKDFQGQKIATALCDELEKGFAAVTTFASVTAKPFFEKRGYAVVKEREAERHGVKLKNYEMKKQKLNK